MSRLARVAQLCLLVLWLPATLHCQLEFLPGFQFLACQPHHDSASTPLQHEDDCGDDACGAVENGLYSSFARQQPLLPPLLFLSPVIFHVTSQAVSRSIPHIPEPPDFPPWQFSARTVAHPRAPSTSC